MSRLSGLARARRLVRLGTDPCLEFRPALLGFVGHAPVEPRRDAALDHLDRCSDCRSDVAAARLVSYAVERAWRDASVALPSVEGWARLKARVERRPASAGRPASPILAVALGMGITVALALPMALPRWSGGTIQEAAPGAAATSEGSAGGSQEVDPSIVRQNAVLFTSAEVQPLSADPVSAPRRPLATLGSAATLVVTPHDATTRAGLTDQDPRHVGQAPQGLEPDPVSAPRRFTVV